MENNIGAVLGQPSQIRQDFKSLEHVNSVINAGSPNVYLEKAGLEKDIGAGYILEHMVNRPGWRDAARLHGKGFGDLNTTHLEVPKYLVCA